MADHDLPEVRAAQNQALFRQVNERLVRLNEAFEQITEHSIFLCECADITCVAEIDMSLAEYGRIRHDPRRFFVAPSAEHVVPEAERVVETHDQYFVVEKIGVAAEIVEAAAEPAIR